MESMFLFYLYEFQKRSIANQMVDRGVYFHAFAAPFLFLRYRGAGTFCIYIYKMSVSYHIFHKVSTQKQRHPIGRLSFYFTNLILEFIKTPFGFPRTFVSPDTIYSTASGTTKEISYSPSGT